MHQVLGANPWIALQHCLDRRRIQFNQLMRPLGTTNPVRVDLVFDLNAEWVYDAVASPSKSANTPFHGWALKGRPTMTLVAGKIVWRESTVAA